MQTGGANRLLQAANAYRAQAVEDLRRKPVQGPHDSKSDSKPAPVQEDLARSIGKGTYLDIKI